MLYEMAGHLIRRLHQLSTQVFQHHLHEAGYDITQVQFATMQALASHPGIEQAQVANLIAYDKATIGGVIDRLEQKGYILRVISRRDRRAREVSLSPEGHRIYELVSPIVTSLQTEILGKLSPDEQEQLITLLKKAVI